MHRARDPARLRRADARPDPRAAARDRSAGGCADQRRRRVLEMGRRHRERQARRRDSVPLRAAVPVLPGARARAGRRARDRLRAPGRAAFVAVVGVIAIAPATVHNWLACRELIAVSAQGGVTFFHGNAPGATGVYHAIPGISENRIQQNIDARTLVAAETDGSWGATSDHFFRKGVAYWRSDPAAALSLVARKLWYFAT